MTPGHTVTTHPADLHIEVRIDGETVAESDRPLLLEETGLPTRYYLPKDDVRMDRFRPTCTFTSPSARRLRRSDGPPGAAPKTPPQRRPEVRSS